MCRFIGHRAVLVCHACTAHHCAPLTNDKISTVVMTRWREMHHQPCVHIIHGIVIHDVGCAHGLPPGVTTPARVEART